MVSKSVVSNVVCQRSHGTRSRAAQLLFSDSEGATVCHRSVEDPNDLTELAILYKIILSQSWHPIKVVSRSQVFFHNPSVPVSDSVNPRDCRSHGHTLCP